MSAIQAAVSIRSGEISSLQLVKACLDRIKTLENNVQAWQFLDPDYSLQQAAAADKDRGNSDELGLLHGVPVGIKDIFDTADMPTENGTPLHADRRPEKDALVVSLLRKAGAVIMGKTVTTELAVYSPGKTRNPCNTAHTPGGSSSGSAASVAAGMVPLAIGSQTNGSIVRPASFCGVIGFKPTYGTISRKGMLSLSKALDHVGVFSRSIEDAAVSAEILKGYDGLELTNRLNSLERLSPFAFADKPFRPRLAFVKTPVWKHAKGYVRKAFKGIVTTLGDDAEEAELPADFSEAVTIHRLIMEADLAKSLACEYEYGAEKLSSMLREMIVRGQKVTKKEYKHAIEKVSHFNSELDTVFNRYDAILTPAVQGEAPLGLESTGSPVFCTLWTLCGVPTMSLPIINGPSGLPVGVQLVCKRGDDMKLLQTAEWIYNTCQKYGCK